MLNDYQKKRIPYGFSFLDVADTERLKEIIKLAETIVAKASYRPVLPSTVDFQDTFEVFGREDIFHLKDHLGDRLALRDDVTVQVIKGFCHQLERESIQKKGSRYYYSVPVFTDVRKNYPSAREVQQFGAELIGLESESAMLELLPLVQKILSEAFSIEYWLVLGDVRLVGVILDELPNAESEKLREAIIRKDVFQITESLVQKGWEKENAFILMKELFYCKGSAELTAQLDGLGRKVSSEQKEFILKIQDVLEPLFALHKKLEKEQVFAGLDPLLLRKPKYYTGFVFEVYVPKISFPPLRGGSYDTLISTYSSQNYPASGFAFDISSLL